MTTRNFNVKNGLTVGDATIDAASGNANLGNVGTAQVFATANITTPQVIANIGSGTSPFLINSNTLVANLNADLLDGYNSSISSAANTVVVRDANSNIAGNNISGTLSTASQPNITSVGTLTSLTVSGTSNLGAVANVTITGGSSGYYLQTNGSGVLTWAAVPTGTGISNGTSNVNIAAANGNVTTSVNGNANILVVTGTGANVNGYLNVSGNANTGNLGTGQVLATANVTTPQVIANIANGTAPFLVNSQTVVANLNADLLDGYNSSVATAANTVVVRDTSGNIAANYYTGNGSQLTGITASQISGISTISNGTSNVNIAAANGNVTTSVDGNANVVVVTGTGMNVAGTLNATGNANVGNLGTATAIITTGNITTVNGNVANASTIIANGSNGTVFANNYTISGAASGNINVSTITGNLGIRALPSTYTDNVAAAGTIGNAAIHALGIPTLTASNAITTTNAATFYIAGAPTASTNVTITNGYALHVAAGNSLFIANVTAGNFTTAGQVVATGNVVSSANLVSNDIIGRTGALTIKSAGTNTNINLQPNGTGNVDVNGAYITSVQTPLNLTDAATKGYVDTLVSTGISIHVAVGAATTTTLATTTGGTITYNQPNGVANGIGATLTTTGSFNLIDGANVQTVGTRILVKNEANAAHNGVYTWANVTTIVRSTDTDTYGAADPDALGQNDYFFVSGGTVNVNTSWICTTVGTITFGSTAINFSQFSATQAYSAGTGLTLSSSLEFSITNTAVTAGSYGNGDRVATFTVNAQGQLTAAANVPITANAANLTGTTLNSTVVNSSLTSVGTLGSLSVTNKVTAGQFQGEGGNLSNIQGANVSGAVTSATNAAAVQSNTATTNTVYLLGTGTLANGNVALQKVSGITANFAANSITATQFNGLLIGNVAGAGTSGGDLTITGATSSGPVYIDAGTNSVSDAQGGNLRFQGGNAGPGNGIGGYTSVWGGNGNSTGTGGYARLVGGTGNGALGGNVFVGGGSNTGLGGNAFVRGGAGSGTDKAGGPVTIVGGPGTGSGQPGNIVFQTSDPLGTGTTTQTLANRIVISGNIVNVTTSVAATSTTSGALVVVGGMGVGGNVYAGAFYGAATGLTSIPGANVTGTVPSATNAAAVQSNTSTNATTYLLTTSTAGNANVALEKVAGITANLANNSITATTFVGSLSGTASNSTNAAAVQSNTSTATAVYLLGTSQPANANVSLEKVTSIYANMSNNAIIATTFSGMHIGNSFTASGAANGNINVTTISGNLGIRALASTYTDNVAAAGTIGNAAIHAIAVPTVAASNAITTTNLATFYIAGAPTAGTNVTATNSYAMYVGAGSSLFNGNIIANNISVSNANVTTANVSGNVLAGNVYANSGTIGAANLTGTLTTASQTNITSVGTLSNLAVTGNVTAGNVRLNGGLTSNRANVAVAAANTVIDQFAPGTFRTAKYIISASGDFGYQSIETLLVHDGTDAYITIYGSISSNVSSELVNLSANINGTSGNVSLYASNIGANVKVNVVSSYIQI